MGGASFKCPKCEKWFFDRGALHDHLVGKHQEPLGFSIVGVAGGARMERSGKGKCDGIGSATDS